MNEVLREAKRIYDLGGAVHWLHPKSKRPIESGWASGPRKEWEYLETTYSEGFNVGVRLGTPSRIDGRFLTVIDLDVKSKEARHREEALSKLHELLGEIHAPSVTSGRGNGSGHFYCLTERPFKTYNPNQSDETVRVHMPSKKPSKAEKKALTHQEIAEGVRLSRAWEISLYSDGRQVVLPPSIHPDTGKLYRWETPLTAAGDLPVIEFKAPETFEDISDREASDRPPREPALTGFKVEEVDLGWLPISDEVRAAIIDGTGVEDRSGYLLRASSALVSAGLTQNEVLTVLTDQDNYLGCVGYQHAQTKNRARAAEWVYRYTLAKVERERSADGVFTKVVDEPPHVMSEEERESQDAEMLEGRHWSQDLLRGGNGGKGAPLKLIKNVVLVLTNAVADDVIKRNEFAYRDSYSCDTPWGGKAGDAISDDDVAKIKFWLSREWDFEPTSNTISDALVVIATENAFDPVKDLLNQMPAWDGTPRLDTWLVKNFEAKGNPEYLAQVFRKWMVAMIMRVYEPGAKFDWMPIFEGAQGIGKSSFGRILVGDQYFLDWLPNLNDKDSALSLQGMWGVEMGELSQFRRNELESIKSFLSRAMDKLRPPYGRRLIESPRRCVFFGTTNRETYLTDDTGNRRFKPIMVGDLDFEALARDRLQLFAEAKYLWDTKKETKRTLELTGMAKIFEKEIHSEKMVSDDSNVMMELMEDFVEKVHAEKVVFNLKKFRVSDLFDGVGPLTKWKHDGRNMQFAGKMLKKMGLKFRHVRGRKFYEIPKNDDFDEKHEAPTHQDFY